jgi:hypothetical protein
MSNHHGPTAAPANVAELVDGELVAAGLADYLEEVAPPLFDELMDHRLSWALLGFDVFGVATIQVIRNETGEAVSIARVHWTEICQPG